MGLIRIVTRQAVRRIAAAKLRSSIVFLIVASTSTVAYADPAFIALHFTIAMPLLIISIRSPRTAQAESAAIWERFGASRRVQMSIGFVEACILGWSATLAGLICGLTWIQIAGVDAHSSSGSNEHTNASTRALLIAAVQLLIITAIAALPVRDFSLARMSRRQRKLLTGIGVTLRVGAVVVGLILATSLALGARTDFGMIFVALIGLPALILVSTIVSGPLLHAMYRGLAKIDALHPMPFMAQRRPSGASIRFAISVGVVIAAVTTFLGASVEQRAVGATVPRVVLERTVARPKPVDGQIAAHRPNVVFVDATVNLDGVLELSRNAIKRPRGQETVKALWRKTAYPVLATRVVNQLQHAFPHAVVTPVREVHTVDPTIAAEFDPTNDNHCQAIVADAANQRVLSIADEPLSIGLTKAAIRHASLMVTTDSGPRHFAAAFEFPA